MRCPLAMPAGMSTVSDTVVGVRPPPSQAGHGSAGTSPAPRHAGQTWVRRNWPKGPRATWRTWPWPPQVAHRIMWLSGAAPEPSQTSQAPMTPYSIGRVTPSADSTNVSWTATPTSSPPAAPCPRPKTSPPKKASNRSWNEPKSVKSLEARPRSPSWP